MRLRMLHCVLLLLRLRSLRHVLLLLGLKLLRIALPLSRPWLHHALQQAPVKSAALPKPTV